VGDRYEAALAEKVFVVPISLRPDTVAHVQIPYDMTAAEAKKIADVVMAFAPPPDTGRDTLTPRDTGGGDG